MCHAQPAVGGSSPGLDEPATVGSESASGAGHTGTAPRTPFHRSLPPTARCVKRDLSATAGFMGCTPSRAAWMLPDALLRSRISQSALNQNNVIFRIPTPLFGLGLVENTPDATLQANLAANQSAKLRLGFLEPSTPAGTTAPSRGLDGRHRTNRCSFFPAKRITWRWA